MRRYVKLVLTALFALALGAQTPDTSRFRAGASSVDITPRKFPVIVNGNFLENIVDKAHDRLYARALVMEHGAVRIAVVVVDSCMMPRDLLDRAKELAGQKTGIPIERMLISATHTHSAPAAMGCLGSDADPDYVEFLPPRIAEAIETAAQRLVPARAGWTVVDDFEHTHCRRWIRRPDKMLTDPFGALTVRANMHPGYENPDVIGPSGPVDPAITMLSIQSDEGKPLALLANYSMHYFGATPVSSDYYGHFASSIATRIGAEGEKNQFVAMMSQGTSGDQMWMDYGKPKSDIKVEAYAREVADVVWRAYSKIEYRSSPSLMMAETTISLGRRAPDAARLAWGRDLLATMAGAKPRNQREVYAREQVFLHENPLRELKLQALRVGDLGITAIPNEVFAITGLKIKARSPLQTTMNIELANGSEGYIPPPEQHKLGGYTTWPARTAALEAEAEPKIVDALVQLLEKVAGKPRRTHVETQGPYARAVLAARPEAYWRMSEFSGSQSVDEVKRNPGRYLDGIAFYLPGPESAAFSGDQINRAVHLAGGRLAGRIETLNSTYSIEMWFWNGLPNNARATTGYLMSRGKDKLIIGGLGPSAGRLLFSGLSGRTEIGTKTWNHAALVRDGRNVRIYLNGKLEISGEVPPATGSDLFIGGDQQAADSLEGKIDEVAVYRRALTSEEIARRYKISFQATSSATTRP